MEKKALNRIILYVVCLVILSSCGQGVSKTASTWQEQYDLGVRYLSEGNYQEAIIAFTAAIEIDPQKAPAYVGRGDAYVLSGKTEENLTVGKADYETAIELDETIAEAWLGLADVYIRQGDYEKALEVLQRGLEKTDQNQNIADKIAEIESVYGSEEKEYFSEVDLEEWGYPIGLSIYDLISKGEADGTALQRFEQKINEGRTNEMSLVSDLPTVYVEVPNGLIKWVVIDKDSNFIGPRGIELGMQMQDVLQVFRCDNEDILDFVGFSDLLQMLEEDESISVYHDVDRVNETTGEHTGSYYAYFGIGHRSDIPYVVLSYVCLVDVGEGKSIPAAWLSVWFNETGVSVIEISYQYN